jgi:hypothetical protein
MSHGCDGAMSDAPGAVQTARLTARQDRKE